MRNQSHIHQWNSYWCKFLVATGQGVWTQSTSSSDGQYLLVHAKYCSSIAGVLSKWSFLCVFLAREHPSGSHHYFGLSLSIQWPLYSPDLNPCDFFQWNYLKDHVFWIGPTYLRPQIAVSNRYRWKPGHWKGMLQNVIVSF